MSKKANFKKLKLHNELLKKFIKVNKRKPTDEELGQIKSRLLSGKKVALKEELEFVKFRYTNYKGDPTPRVKVLDFNYPGRPGQKTYGQRKDLLGWNLNYFNNKREAKKAIDDIDSFARLISSDNKEKYERIKYFFPEQAKHIRRYMRKHIKGIKKRNMIGLWSKTSYDDLIRFDRENY